VLSPLKKATAFSESEAMTSAGMIWFVVCELLNIYLPSDATDRHQFCVWVQRVGTVEYLYGEELELPIQAVVLGITQQLQLRFLSNNFFLNSRKKYEGMLRVSLLDPRLKRLDEYMEGEKVLSCLTRSYVDQDHDMLCCSKALSRDTHWVCDSKSCSTWPHCHPRGDAQRSECVIRCLWRGRRHATPGI
jgi:hypothetical protein